jgi:hypothetical protein
MAIRNLRHRLGQFNTGTKLSFNLKWGLYNWHLTFVRRIPFFVVMHWHTHLMYACKYYDDTRIINYFALGHCQQLDASWWACQSRRGPVVKCFDEPFFNSRCQIWPVYDRWFGYFHTSRALATGLSINDLSIKSISHPIVNRDNRWYRIVNLNNLNILLLFRTP